jgi:hypothetical protein
MYPLMSPPIFPRHLPLSSLLYALVFSLLCALLGGCATEAGVVYPGTPARNALMDRIIERAMLGSRIGLETKAETDSPETIADEKISLAREANRISRSEAYWNDYRAIELSYATLLAKTDELALQTYRTQMQNKLSLATDAQLQEFSGDNRLLDNNAFLYLGRRYDLIRNDYVAFRKIYPINCLRSYVQAMDALEKKYPVR